MPHVRICEGARGAIPSLDLDFPSLPREEPQRSQHSRNLQKRVLSWPVWRCENAKKVPSHQLSGTGTGTRKFLAPFQGAS